MTPLASSVRLLGTHGDRSTLGTASHDEHMGSMFDRNMEQLGLENQVDVNHPGASPRR